MKFYSFLLFILFFTFQLSAMEIDSPISSKLARDSYLKKQEFANIYKTDKNSIMTGQAYGVRYFVIEDSKNTVITIRGTDNIRNMITDVMASETNFLDDKFILVHQGFYKIAKKIFQTIKLDTKKEVVLVGHSLGGAVSLLYGAMLKEKGIDVSIYTFGMPPVVNKFFLKKYKDLKHYRHFHIFDPVPSLSKPTIQVFQTQMKFKSFQSAKNTISNMISTIQNIPDKYRHHGAFNAIKERLNVKKEELENSLFFKTCTLYFDYHKIDNYVSSLQKFTNDFLDVSDKEITYVKKTIKPKKQETRKIKIIPSVVKGTIPLEVEFYVDTAGYDIEYYYFNFGKKELFTKELKNNKVHHTFTTSGKHPVKIALKDKFNNVVETKLTITTREPTFQEYQDAIGKEFEQYMKSY